MTDTSVTEFIGMMARFTDTAKLILEFGRHYTEFAPEHTTIRRGEMGECYANAGRMAFDNPRLRYVEGYAVPATVPLPMMHAWLIDADDRIIDPTWPDGTAYFGVPIPRATYSELLMRLGYWGVLDNLWIDRDAIHTLREGLATCDL
jgi:hypothetical protein